MRPPDAFATAQGVNSQPAKGGQFSTGADKAELPFSHGRMTALTSSALKTLYFFQALRFYEREHAPARGGRALLEGGFDQALGYGGLQPSPCLNLRDSQCLRHLALGEASSWLRGQAT